MYLSASAQLKTAHCTSTILAREVGTMYYSLTLLELTVFLYPRLVGEFRMAPSSLYLYVGRNTGELV